MNADRAVSSPYPSNAPRVLVVAGMHRSGTSLIANWLSRCGLNVGDELLQGKTDNPAGHYEDLSFLHLHQDILRENSLDHLVVGHQTIMIPEKHRIQAQTLIDAKQTCAQWGWKDPRTALFLDFWHSLLPDMKMLVVYRPYALVADSLLRREYKRSLRTKHHTRWQRRLLNSRRAPWIRRIPLFLPIFGAGEYRIRTRLERLRCSFLNVRLLRRYLQVWVRYNNDILAAVAAHPDQALVAHIDDLFLLSNQVIDFLNREWGFSLRAAAVEDVYAEGMLRTQPMRFRGWLCSLLVPACQSAHAELTSRRAQTQQKLLYSQPSNEGTAQ